MTQRYTVHSETVGPIVGIFGSSNTYLLGEGNSQPREFAVRVGVIMPYAILTGGSPGLPYRAVSAATAILSDRLSIGVSPFMDDAQHYDSFIELGLLDHQKEELKEVRTSHTSWLYTGLGNRVLAEAAKHRNIVLGDVTRAIESRNKINVKLSDVVCVFPGGRGTLNELELSIKSHKPLVAACGLSEDFDLQVKDLVARNNHTQIRYVDNPNDMIRATRDYAGAL